LAGSFISSQIPETSTPFSALKNLANSLVHQLCAFGAVQSGKAVGPGQTTPSYRSPLSYFRNTSCCTPVWYVSYESTELLGVPLNVAGSTMTMKSLPDSWSFETT
jgi:hypothetical protein